MSITATVDTIPLGAHGLIISFGQSNASLVADTDDLPAGRENLANPNPLVQRSRRAYNDEADFVPNDTALGDIGPVGQSMGYELSLAEGLGANHLILQYSVSGSTMQHWDTVDRWSDLYNWADSQIALYPYPVYLKGIILCQGESEIGLTIGTWVSRLTTQIPIMRAHFGRARAPLIIIETNEDAEPIPGSNGIQAKQAELAAALAHARVRDTHNYPGDPLHWRAPEMVYIGDDVADDLASPP